MSFSKRTFVIFIIFIVALVGLLAFMVLRDQIRLKIGDYLIIQDNLQPVDVIHVIAGDDYRTRYAIQLYQQGYAKMLFFTGGWCTFHNYYHGAHALQLALDAGIPRNAIAYDESEVQSTYDEVLLLQKYLVENQSAYHSIMAVSDPFHMRRAKWTYQRILDKKNTILMAPVPFNQTPFKPSWLADIISLCYVREEYKKMVFYFFRYQLNFKWLASFDKY